MKLNQREPEGIEGSGLFARTFRPRRQLLSAALLAASLAAADCPASQESAYLAEVDPTSGVRLLSLDGGHAAQVAGELGWAEWRRFGLRGLSSQDPAGDGSVREIGGDLPRIDVRGEYQIIAFGSLLQHEEGLAVVRASGPQVMISDSSNRYRPVDEGAAVSAGGEWLAMMVKGLEIPEVLIVELSVQSPRVRRVTIPDPYKDIEPLSITLTGDALFFGASLDNGQWVVYRAAPLTPGDSGPLSAEVIAGPVKSLSPSMVSSQGAAAFLAGDRDDHLDVFTARASGAADNITLDPGPYIPQDGATPHLAVSRDGLQVGCNLVLNEPETFLLAVSDGGPADALDITADVRFNPYIVQESFIFFNIAGRLIFAGGHSQSTTDLFSAGPRGPSDVINLTRTGSGLTPPFLTKGTLSIDKVFLVGADSVLVSASGFPTGPGITLISTSTGERILDGPGLVDLSDVFTLGDDLYFMAAEPSGDRGLFRIRQGILFEVDYPPSATPPHILLKTPALAIAAVPRMGLVELTAGAEPRTLAAGSDFTPSAALSPDGSRLIFGRTAAGGGWDYFIIDLATGAEAPTSSSSLGAVVLALSVPPPVRFIRGDVQGDGMVDISDPIVLLGYLFLGGVEYDCLEASDTNDDGTIDLSDPIHILFHLFGGDGPLPLPFPEPGIDPTPDDLGCNRGP